MRRWPSWPTFAPDAGSSPPTPPHEGKTMFSKMLAAALIGLGATASAAQAQTVTSTANAGAGTLRAAINQANANANLSVIDFNLPAAGGNTITPALQSAGDHSARPAPRRGRRHRHRQHRVGRGAQHQRQLHRRPHDPRLVGRERGGGIQVDGQREQRSPGNQIGTDAAGRRMRQWNQRHRRRDQRQPERRQEQSDRREQRRRAGHHRQPEHRRREPARAPVDGRPRQLRQRRSR